MFPLHPGSVVSVQAGIRVTGIVGDDGRVYMSGLDGSGILKGSMGKNSQEQCQIPYTLKNKKSLGLYSENSEMYVNLLYFVPSEVN